jgi:hypothetical protein
MPTSTIRWTLIAPGGIVAVTVIVSAVKGWGPLPWNVTLQNLTPLLAPLVMASAVVERAVEILISPWRDPDASKLVTALAIEKAAASPDPEAVKKASNALDEYKGQTQRYASGTSLTLSALAALAGVRALGPFANLSATPADQHEFFTCVDMVLTTALLAGGADGIHSIVNAITSFADSTAKQATSKAASPSG